MSDYKTERHSGEPVKRIEFQLGAEKQIKISTAGRSASLFYEGYRQGLAGVVEIMRASILYTQNYDCFYEKPKWQMNLANRISQPGGYQQTEDSPGCTQSKSDENLYNYPNNMIVYSGGRGTGKSSAMLTFVDSLTRPDSGMFQRQFLRDMVACELLGLLGIRGNTSEDANSAEDGRLQENVEAGVSLISELLRKSTFLSLPPIDPTMMENHAQILIDILARMFQMAERTWERNRMEQNRQRSINDKNELMRQFTVCYDCVSAIKRKEERRQEFEGLDVLASLGDSSMLKMQMAKLIEKLLRFIVPEAGRDSYLVLQIDDTDMNVEQAYTILEDIRKYLVIPQLIIVLAADLEHLLHVIQSNMRKSYAHTSILADVYAIADARVIADEYVYRIASQYINKLIPQSRRISLPDIGIYLKEYPETRIIYKPILGEQLLPDKKEGQFPDTQEQIFRLIYRKTGMIFLRHDHHLHYIIPDNMRQLNQFLAMLMQMNSVVDPDSADAGFFLSGSGDTERCAHIAKLQNRLQNVQRFRDYFLDVWATNALEEKDAQYLREVAAANLPDKGKIVCTILRSKLLSAKDTQTTSSYVDMIRLLRQQEQAVFKEQDKKAVFAFHVYFSLIGHTIALKDLISYYSNPRHTNNEGNKGEEDCSFQRLYPLFGSRLFSYRTNQENSENENFVIILPESFNKNIKKCYTRWLVQRWSDMKSDADMALNPQILYSLFCPYDLPDNEDDIWADFASPIINTLYISPKNQSSLLAEKRIPSVEPKLWKGPNKESPDVKWQDIQTNSLLVVLNWDVQQRLGERLMMVTKNHLPHVNECSKDFWLNLAAFYDYLENPFISNKEEILDVCYDPALQSNPHKTTDSTESEKPKEFAIRCLKNITLQGWLKRLEPETLKKEKEMDIGKMTKWSAFSEKFYVQFTDDAKQQDTTGTSITP